MIFFGLFLGGNACRQGLDGYFRKLDTESKVTISVTKGVTQAIGNYGIWDGATLRNVFQCVIGKVSRESIVTYLDSSDWALSASDECEVSCGAYDFMESDCLACWQTELMTSTSAYEDFCHRFDSLDCDNKFSFRKFQKKVRNCLDRKVEVTDISRLPSSRMMANDVGMFGEEFEGGFPMKQELSKLYNRIAAGINEKDPHYKSLLRCMEIESSDLINFASQSIWFAVSLQKCNSKCQKGTKMWLCARCWKSTILVDNGPYSAFCNLPYQNCDDVSRSDWTQKTNFCINKLAKKVKDTYNHLLMNGYSFK